MQYLGRHYRRDFLLSQQLGRERNTRVQLIEWVRSQQSSCCLFIVYWLVSGLRGLIGRGFVSCSKNERGLDTRDKCLGFVGRSTQALGEKVRLDSAARVFGFLTWVLMVDDKL